MANICVATFSDTKACDNLSAEVYTDKDAMSAVEAVKTLADNEINSFVKEKLVALSRLGKRAFSKRGVDLASTVFGARPMSVDQIFRKAESVTGGIDLRRSYVALHILECDASDNGNDTLESQSLEKDISDLIRELNNFKLFLNKKDS